MSARGVISGARHSTWTVDASPWESITSNAMVAFRTTLVKLRAPSIIRRLAVRLVMITEGQRRALVPVRLYQGARESTPDSTLPLDKFPTAFRFSLALVHPRSQRRDLGESPLDRISQVLGWLRRTFHELLKLAQSQNLGWSPQPKHYLPTNDIGEFSAQVAANIPQGSTGSAEDSFYTSSGMI